MTENRTENRVFSFIDRRLGEERLADSQVFAEYGLCLYCDVPLSDLEDVFDPTPWPQECDARSIDYLVCRGDDVVLAIEIEDRDDCLGPHHRVEGLRFEEMTARQMARGETDGAENATEDILHGDFSPRWRCRVSEIGEDLAARLEKNRLIETRETAMSPKKKFTVPSRFGADMGLVRAYLPDYMYDSFMCVTAVSERAATRIEKLLAPSENAELYREKIPFAERMERERSGLACNDIHSVNAVRAMAELPVQSYLVEFPDELARLERAVTVGDATYAQIAGAIDEMLQSENTRNCAVGAMLALVEPMVRFYERGQRPE